MAGDRKPDPYYDFATETGREKFRRLLDDEVRTMADNHSRDVSYRRLRGLAVQFFETNYTDTQLDALIPYMAMTLLDRFFLDHRRQIPKVAIDQFGSDNINLFFTCCLTISWKLRTKRFDLTSFLEKKGLARCFSVENVIEMEADICKGLDWRLRPVMPFSYIDFFAPFLNLPPNSPSALRPVYQLIVKSQFDIAFTEFRPSVMAASAMLVFTKKELPDQVDAYGRHIIEDEFFKDLQGMINRCEAMLAPLYSGPSPVDRAAPSIGAPTRSESIPIGRSSHRGGQFVDEEEPPAPNTDDDEDEEKGKEPAPNADDGEPSRREGKQPAANADDGEQPSRHEGKEPVNADDDEEPRSRRAGKEIMTAAAAEINQQREMGGHGLDYDYVADLMSFSVGWNDAQIKAAEINPSGSGPLTATTSLASFLAQRLSCCCNIL